MDIWKLTFYILFSKVNVSVLINVCLLFEHVFLCSLFNVALFLVRIGMIYDKPLALQRASTFKENLGNTRLLNKAP